MSQLRSVTCHMGSHSVTCCPTQVNAPRLHPSQSGRYSIYLPRRGRRLSWPREGLTSVGTQSIWRHNQLMTGSGSRTLMLPWWSFISFHSFAQCPLKFCHQLKVWRRRCSSWQAGIFHLPVRIGVNGGDGDGLSDVIPLMCTVIPATYMYASNDMNAQSIFTPLVSFLPDSTRTWIATLAFPPLKHLHSHEVWCTTIFFRSGTDLISRCNRTYVIFFR